MNWEWNHRRLVAQEDAEVTLKTDDYQNRADEPCEDQLQVLFNDAPGHGDAIEIADGIWWARIDLDGGPGHVNVYLLRGDSGWVLVDTGNNTPSSRQALESLFQRAPFRAAPLRYVIVTHFHPEHIGLAGLLCGKGVRMVCSRSCWSTAALLCVPNASKRRVEQVEFMKHAGLAGIELEAFFRSGKRDYHEVVTPPPHQFLSITQGSELKIGSRLWRVELGQGHAADHVTLWSNDHFVISGDQILPGISSNLSVPANEPDSDTVTQWITSCERMGALARPDTKCLPGHNVPFIGISRRCDQLKDNHLKAIDRLLPHLSIPRTATDCLQAIYRRQLSPHEFGSLVSEAVGYLNHLSRRGIVERKVVNGAYLWSRHSSRLVRVEQPYDLPNAEECLVV